MMEIYCQTCFKQDDKLMHISFPLTICILETHKHYFGNSENLDKILHNFVRVFTVCLDKKRLETKMHNNLEILTCDTLIYTLTISGISW